jgi:hypothetical protein
MKLMFALTMLLLVSACVAVAGDRKAGGDTAVVCHRGRNTLELPRNAVQAHLNHGDRLGPC